jgi:hypothetical protein
MTLLPGSIRGWRIQPGSTTPGSAARIISNLTVLLLAVLHFIPEPDDPAGIVHALTSALAPGSISHLTADFAPPAVTAGVGAYNTLVPESITARTRAQVTALLTGLPLIPPGIVPVTAWRPDLPDPSPPDCDLYAGLARTPGPHT